MWICCKHSNNNARQVETPGKSTISGVRQIYFVARHDFHVAWRLRYIMTVLKYIKNAMQMHFEVDRTA